MAQYLIRQDGIEISAWLGNERLAKVDLHEAPGLLYAGDMESYGDPGALRALIRHVCGIAKERSVLLHVDARSANALRLCRLYSRIGTLEYLTFKVT